MKPETRQRLVEVARDLFLQQGYAATGIAQILQKADAGSGSLYYFFPTKEDLLLAVLDWYLDNLCPEVLDPVFTRVSDPIERIFGILDGYRKMLLATDFAQGCPVGNLSLELCNSHPAARAKIVANFTQWRHAVQHCLDDAAGRLPSDIDRQQLAQFVLTVMEGAVMLARADRSIDSYDAAVTSLRDYFERLQKDGTDWAKPRRRAKRKRSTSHPHSRSKS